MIVDRLGANPLVLQLPWGTEADLHGVIDLVEMKGHYWEGEMGEEWKDTDIPAEYREAADLARHELFEKLADHDEALMEKFIAEDEPTVEELRRAIRAATLSNAGVPVLCGSAFKNKGVQLVLDAVVQYLPSPWTCRRSRAISPNKEDSKVLREPDDAAPFSALAFKIMSDDFVGRLTYLRIYSGVLHAGTHVLNSTKDKKERIGRVLQMHANHREDLAAAYTGDIVAVVGLKHSTTGDTICDPNKPVVLESISFPTPVISVAVEPKTKADQDKLGNGLMKLSDEDPTFVVKFDDETGQTVISGMGELHLDIIVDRLKREFTVDANVGKPQVAYRETIRKQVHKVEARFIRQTGGKGQFGHVVHRPRAHGPRRWLRVHQQDRGRQGPAGVHPGRGPGHPGGARQRHPGRLPHGGRARHAHRRLLPRGRLLGDGLQDRGLHGRQGGRPQGRPLPAGAGHGVRGHHPGGLHGRRHG